MLDHQPPLLHSAIATGLLTQQLAQLAELKPHHRRHSETTLVASDPS